MTPKLAKGGFASMAGHRWPGPRPWELVGASVALVLALAGTRPGYGQEVDPGLHGRLLQRSDGTLYVYKDGWKYRVEVAEADDELIDSVPEMEVSVAQLDQLFLIVAPQPLPPPPPPPEVIYISPPLVIPGPYIAVANPVPGDTLAVGGLNIQGKAFDPVAGADRGTGIDRVQVFLEDRDRGGLYLGDARLGRPNLAAEPGSQFALAGGDIVVSLPPGAHNLYVYGRSAITGKESTVSIPIKVGTGA